MLGYRWERERGEFVQVVGVREGSWYCRSVGSKRSELVQVLGGREGGWYKCWESERERGVGTVEVLGVREESWYC